MIFANRPEGCVYLRNFISYAHTCGWRGAWHPSMHPYATVENDNDHTDRTVTLLCERTRESDYRLSMSVRVWIGNGADLRSDIYDVPTTMPWTALLGLDTEDLIERLKHPQLIV